MIFVYYNKEPIFLTSQSQKIVPLGLYEVWNMTLLDVAMNGVWIRQVLRKLKIATNSITIYQDESGTVQWAAEGRALHYSRRSHAFIEHQFVTNIIIAGKTCIVKVQIEATMADFLTKPLGPRRLALASSKLQLFLTANQHCDTPLINICSEAHRILIASIYLLEAMEVNNMLHSVISPQCERNCQIIEGLKTMWYHYL